MCPLLFPFLSPLFNGHGIYIKRLMDVNIWFPSRPCRRLRAKSVRSTKAKTSPDRGRVFVGEDT